MYGKMYEQIKLIELEGHNMNNLEEKTLSTQPIFSGKVISLQVDEVELPNGKKAKRELIKHPGAVAIIAMTDENKLVLVEQYRKALQRTIVEIPAGKLEKGEEPLECAKRELEEETGYECKTIELVNSFYTSPGFADEIVHVYLAKGLTKKENAAGLDEDEFVNLLEWTLDEADRGIAEKQIYDAKTIFAVQYLQLQEAIKHK
jgi:ADP-ribose pyrophosphatase